ncbi:hypothetical protein MMB232_01690 [Brevundimonas subvibrioides]|jgi:hypothetical protein|uniref:Uncharacterized protein n=1 Tax=Brevundimonas subvibrioides (strain ATCC 15264 / DSM 4735 / LMG 14903 / NBRC 16000 / CB 81) TaxID=633149 RepID=D9QH89_BRESC|nr:hypothetical protein [Brevundimonas subvibrioides]ADL01055.1 conserved hypothetical protein [Brevundimonas subvibrioides ATCC 15264]
MQHTRDLKGVVTVDGDDYEWEVRRQPQRTTGNEWQGIGVALRLVEGQREALVQFPMVMRASGIPNFERQRINVESIKNAVASAIAAGWNPTSRGKVVVFDVDADGR